MNILYLHGFNSAFSADNPKIKALSKIGKVIPFSYDSFAKPEVIQREICKFMDKTHHAVGFDDWLIVGTSLGAYHALELARVIWIPVVVINPCIDPRKHFELLGQNEHFVNYVTNKTKTLDSSAIAEYTISKGDSKEYCIPPLIIVDLGDEILDSQATLRHFHDCVSVAFLKGSHRFDHINESIEMIQEYATNSMLASDLNS